LSVSPVTLPSGFWISTKGPSCLRKASGFIEPDNCRKSFTESMVLGPEPTGRELQVQRFREQHAEPRVPEGDRIAIFRQPLLEPLAVQQRTVRRALSISRCGAAPSPRARDDARPGRPALA